MTSEVVTLPDQSVARRSEATAIEQSRAIEEVRAAAVLARQFPRDMQQALAAMREACQQPALAERAFFSYKRAGSTVSGASIHLAKELARVWQNIDYGIKELRRDEAAGESEMLAFAWDLETNTRNSSTFIVPHSRDTKQGRKQLTELRDVYENNANNGARRVREAIFAVLPKWFTVQAEAICNDTLKTGGGVPLAERIANMLTHFATIDIAPEQLEQRLDTPKGKWTDQQVANLGVVFQSIQRGELDRDEEFPPKRVTAAEITGKPQPDDAPAGGLFGDDSQEVPADA